MGFTRGGSIYRKLDIRIGRKANKLRLEEHGMTPYHAFDKIRWLCTEAFHQKMLSDRHKAFIEMMNKEVPPTADRIKAIALIILDPAWELKEFWDFLDRDKYWIQDYAEYIDSII